MGRGLGWSQPRGPMPGHDVRECMPSRSVDAGYKGDESAETVFELTYNWGVSSYELGNAFAQVAISTQVRQGRGAELARGRVHRIGHGPDVTWPDVGWPTPVSAALSVQDVYKTTESARQAGARVVREPGELPGLGTKIMALTDPDGYKLVFVDEADFAKELDDAAKKG